MDEAGPRVRRRGFFFHVETPELDHAEQESAEGVRVRLRAARPRAERSIVSSARKPTHAIRTSALSSPNPEPVDQDSPQDDSPSVALRLASGTGNHRQARMSR